MDHGEQRVCGVSRSLHVNDIFVELEVVGATKCSIFCPCPCPHAFSVGVAHHGPWVMLPKEQPDNDVRENSPCAPQTDRESTSELIHGN
jgi:hypothetical protein